MNQIKSMTGFGSSETNHQNLNIKSEIKSLNNKFLELGLKIPKSYKDKEIEIRQIITQKVQRGSVTFSLSIERTNNSQGNDTLKINHDLAKSYHNKLVDLSNKLDNKERDLFNIIINLPDVLKYEENESNEEEWTLILNNIAETIEKFDRFRLQEGNTISLYIQDCLSKILTSLALVENEENDRKEAIKNKLYHSLKENQEEINIDKNRFEQELVYYLEKIDIGEEKSRLKQHISYFNSCLENDASGKKLTFISQEIGREINTLGSKAYHFPIQQQVVCMKEELEKIKEQLLNVL